MASYMANAAEAHLKTLLLASLLLGAVDRAYPITDHAYSNSLDMTCAQAKDYIARHGAAVLATGNASASFSSGYCGSQASAYVCTKEVRFCNVGVYCDYNYSPLN